jgi:hypothetical protein
LQPTSSELVPLHKGCLGTNPTIDVTLNGSSLLQILALQCPISGALGFLSSKNLGSLFVSLSQSKRPTCTEIDFQTKGDGTVLTWGAYEKKEWFDNYGLAVTASGGYCPNGTARIFNTSKPGTLDIRDRDMGSPNRKCSGGGPDVHQKVLNVNKMFTCKVLPDNGVCLVELDNVNFLLTYMFTLRLL